MRGIHEFGKSIAPSTNSWLALANSWKPRPPVLPLICAEWIKETVPRRRTKIYRKTDFLPSVESEERLNTATSEPFFSASMSGDGLRGDQPGRFHVIAHRQGGGVLIAYRRPAGER